jgi:hypothetical protein
LRHGSQRLDVLAQHDLHQPATESPPITNAA